MFKFNVDSIEVITNRRSDMYGYAIGYISFDNDKTCEFTYRFDDEENGKNNTIVSIDYGYLINGIDNIWNEIEKVIYNQIKEYLHK